MSDEIRHECGVALVRLLKPQVDYRAKYGTSDWGGTKLSLLLEKQHNRGQDGAGAAILRACPVPGESAYVVFRSASPTPLVDLLGMIAKRVPGADEQTFLGHLRYATFGKDDVACCHPFVHKSSVLSRTLLLAGNFNLTDNRALFERYVALGHHPDSRADGYLLTQLMAHYLGCALDAATVPSSPPSHPSLSAIVGVLRASLQNVDGAYTLCGMTGDGWCFAVRDPHGIRPGYVYIDDEVAVVASERPAIQAAFDVAPEAVKELPPGAALVISPAGEVSVTRLFPSAAKRSCSFERIYFSRANDCAIHRERKALGAALADPIMKAVGGDFEHTFFSYIPNSAQVAFHGLLEKFIGDGKMPRFGQIAVKDAKFRTFIADAAARREFYKHVYDVTYGLVRPGVDTLVVLDDSIVRGNTMKRAILPMLDRLGPKRIVIVSSAPPIRYPDCYGIDMSTLGELIAFKALVNLLGETAEMELRQIEGELSDPFDRTTGLTESSHAVNATKSRQPAGETEGARIVNPLAPLYARFTPAEHDAEIARLLTPPGLKAEVTVVFQTVEALHAACPDDTGDWYFTGDYPTPGGSRVLRTALKNYLEKNDERSY